MSRNGRKTERVGGMSVITVRVDKCDLKCYFKNKLIFTQICAVLCLVYGLLFGDPGNSQLRVIQFSSSWQVSVCLGLSASVLDSFVSV